MISSENTIEFRPAWQNIANNRWRPSEFHIREVTDIIRGKVEKFFPNAKFKLRESKQTYYDGVDGYKNMCSWLIELEDEAEAAEFFIYYKTGVFDVTKQDIYNMKPPSKRKYALKPYR